MVQLPFPHLLVINIVLTDVIMGLFKGAKHAAKLLKKLNFKLYKSCCGQVLLICFECHKAQQ